MFPAVFVVCVCGCCAAPRLLHIVVRRCPEGISCDLLISEESANLRAAVGVGITLRY